MRLDKFLANLKLGSRKDVKKIIKSGQIKVNNEPVKKDDYKLKPSDIVSYNDQVLEYKEYVYYLLNKPAGFVSATVDNLYPTVISLIDDYHELFPVGRLDVDTTGLLLITNDGEFSHKLTSPKYHVNKKYYVEFSGTYHSDIPEIFKNRIQIDDYLTLPAKYEYISDSSCYVTICEGKFHQVKLMMKSVGLTVTKLERVSFAFLELENTLSVGSYRELREEEVMKLKNISKEVEGDLND